MPNLKARTFDRSNFDHY